MEELNANLELTEKPKLASYKALCAKLGFMMCVYFLCRIAAVYVSGLVYGLDEVSPQTAYIAQAIISVMLIYMVPLLVTMILFKSFGFYADGKLKPLYQRPKRLAKILGNFPAMYGLGYGTALLTMLGFFLISRFSGNQTTIERYFDSMSTQGPSDLVSALAMVFMMVIIAPVVEEFWMRGIVYDALTPYGTGAAIVISSILFGLMHGSMEMLFYTTALGFALGYIRYATNSLFVVTILHLIINAVGAGMLLISSLVKIENEQNRWLNTLLNYYQLAMLILIAVGLAAFIRKIPVIRRYKVENAWTEIGGRKKIALFFVSVPVLIMVVLAINEHADNVPLIELIELIRG